MNFFSSRFTRRIRTHGAVALLLMLASTTGRTEAETGRPEITRLLSTLEDRGTQKSISPSAREEASLVLNADGSKTPEGGHKNAHDPAAKDTDATPMTVAVQVGIVPT